MGLRAQTQKCSLNQIQRYNENKRNISKMIKEKDKKVIIHMLIIKANDHLQDVK